MKRALTLIELIFTIVIIAFTFSVLPRVIYVSNKSLQAHSKEDAIFNLVAKAMDLSLKEYDQKNLTTDEILISLTEPLQCKKEYDYLRIGGFKGSRNCKHLIAESDIPTNTSGEYDYIEGYNGVSEVVSSGNRSYTLTISVGYTDEWNSYDSDSLDFTFTKRSDNSKTNIKRVYIKIYQGSELISSIPYYSANIGHIQIKSLQW